MKIQDGVLSDVENRGIRNGTFEIPEGVTGIGDYAFAYCENLESIEIPDSVTHIGAFAFEDCENLESIRIPDSVMYIGTYAFYDCPSLKSVELPVGCKCYGNTFSRDTDVTRRQPSKEKLRSASVAERSR